MAETKKPAKKPVASWKTKKTPVTKSVTIQLDGDVTARIQDLQASYAEARRLDSKSNTPDKAPAIQYQLDALIEEAKKTEQVFKFRSIGRPRYEELLREHPPTARQKKDLQAVFNTDTFPPALISAASFDPEISLEDAEEIFSSPDWNNAELLKLYFAAEQANTESADIPLSKGGYDKIVDSALKSIIALKEGSPTPTSSDE